MAKFKYTAKDSMGKIAKGALVAQNQNEVLMKLQGQSLIPVSIVEVSGAKGGSLYDRLNESLLSMQSKVPLKDIVFFTRQMTTFLNAGVGIAKSIKNISVAQKNLVFKKILEELYDDINSGTEFSEALGKHPKTFSQMYRSIVRAGEATGKLDEALISLTKFMERADSMAKAIKSASMYPKFVSIFTALIVFVMLWKIIPVFEDLYASMGGELPLPTQVMVDLSAIIQSYFWFVIFGIIGLFVAIKIAFKARTVRNLWDKFRINVPIFGTLARQIIISRTTSTLALLMRAGTSMIDALEISGKAAQNNEFDIAMEKSINDVKNGSELSVSMRKFKVWPDVMIQLLETGEETGKIDDMMQKIADYYEEEVDLKIKGFASLIEPLLIVVMGVVIGSIVIAIYLPMFTMGDMLG